MSYGPAQAAKTFRAIRDGVSDPDAQAELEFFLLDQLQQRGAASFGNFLTNLPDLTFEHDSTDAGGHVHRYIESSGSPPLAVSFSLPGEPELLEVMTFINVEVMAADSPVVPQKPGHQAFYATWEAVGLLDSVPPESTPWERAVFLIGLLEAELMNGGFGQYLTNTNGRYLTETLEHLEHIGASRAHSLLRDAVALAAQAPSFAEAWDVRSKDYEALDSELLANSEDLAGLCYARCHPSRHSA